MGVLPQITRYIEKHDLLEAGEHIVVGVSGGPDSLCLLDVLSRWGAELVVAHLDHRLRDESASEAAFVQEIAQSYGLHFELGIANLIDDGGGSLEERARLSRYRFLVEIAQKHGIRKIAVGHTVDDQVETILMHFLRGAGPSGLRGMLPATPIDNWVGIDGGEGITVVRPMLAISHAETIAHCETIGLDARFDRSNLDRTFFRNRIRHELLPALEAYNPGVRSVIHNLGEVMRAVDRYLRSQVNLYWSDSVTKLDPDAIIIRGQIIRSLPLALQRRIVRRAILELRPQLRDLGFNHIDRTLGYLHDSKRSASRPVIDDLMIFGCVEDGVLTSSVEDLSLPDYPQIRDSINLVSPFPNEISLAYGWRLLITEVTDISVKAAQAYDREGFDVVLDYEKIGGNLLLRTRKPGDRIQPLGMQGSMKVSDLMINKRIPRLARQHWPILESRGQIAWVPAAQIAEPFRVADTTRRALRMTITAE
jgi:tRNA(Ile)-lysidine synthase